MMIVVLILIFIVLSLLVGGDRTAKTLITLMFNAAVLFFSIAAIAAGLHPAVVAPAAIMLVICITLFYQNEVNDKTKAAFISIMIVAAVMTILIFVFIYGGHLQGMSTVGQSKIRESNGYSGSIGVNMSVIEVFVILMTLVGAVIDTAVAVASGVYEVARHNPEQTRKELTRSGLKIGSSILSSTVNTLLFIFAGEYLIMFINFAMYYSFETMINSREFSQGIINMIISATACIIVIPVTSYFAAHRFTVKER